MAQLSNIREHMEVIGADGAHVGTVDGVEGDRIKLTKKDSGEESHRGHHHYLSSGLVAAVEGDKVRLSTTGANAFMFQEEQGTGTTGSTSSTSSSRYSTYEKPTANKQQSAKPDWGLIGWSAAGLGAIAATALLLRRQPRKKDDFALRLQNDENVRLISSAKVEGTSVVGGNGEQLGRIENFMVDKYSGRVAYAVMSFGGTMGLGTSLFPLPWSNLTYDVEKDGYVLNITKKQLANAPKFQATETPEFSTSYRRDLAAFYDRPAAA